MSHHETNNQFVLAEYIWTDADGNLRSKTKVIHNKTHVTLADLPKWNFDGSSTGQAPGHDSEVILKPQAVYYDPLRDNGSVLVMCDLYDPRGNPIPTNSRFVAEMVFAAGVKEEPWFGIEQEYTLFKDGVPLGWPTSSARSFGGPTVQLGYPGAQGPYYCGVGSDVSFGRDIVEDHLLMCCKAGLAISGINGEVMPGQWEYQIGPCTGISSGDQMAVSRFLLHRICEKYGVVASLDPKPVPGDWNGAGCHTNFSTKKMREHKNGLAKYIFPAVEKLGKRHAEHIALYGAGNEARLTGKHETASISVFRSGVADRGASIRIPNATNEAGRGYFEDRRPASNMDPYLVTAKIFDTCCLDGKYAAQFPSTGALGVETSGTSDSEYVKVSPINAAKKLMKKKTSSESKKKKKSPKAEKKTGKSSSPKNPKRDPDESSNTKQKQKNSGCVAQ